MKLQTSIPRFALVHTRLQHSAMFRTGTMSYSQPSRYTRLSTLVPTKRNHTTSTHIGQKSSWTHPVYVQLKCSLEETFPSPSLIIKSFVSDMYHLSARYTKEQILAVRTAHRKAHTWQDRAALGTVRLLRWGMDLVSGYHTRPTNKNTLSKAHVMTEEKWITRFVFLESVAGVPGMVAGMLRHLKSIRRMRRDNGWWVNPNHLLHTGQKMI